MESNDNENHIILLLDPRGIIFQGGADVAARQNLYGRQLKIQSKNTKVQYMIFSSDDHVKSYGEFKYVNVFRISKPTVNSFIFAKKSYNYIKAHNLNIKFMGELLERLFFE